MEVSDAKRLKAFQEENAKLKKLLGESMLDVSTLREMLGKIADVHRVITENGCSRCRACRLVGADPRFCRYRSTRGDDQALRRRLRELSSERRRFGYRRLHILLRREGREVNWKKLYSIYREERLTVRKRGGRKRARGTRAPMAIPRTSAGASTSCPTPCPAGGGSGCCASSTTSAGNASLRS